MLTIRNLKSSASSNKISDTYIRFAFSTFVFALILSSLFGFFIWKEHQDKTLKKCKKASFEIKKILEESFKEARNIMFLIGKEIAKDGTTNTEQVVSHLKLIDPHGLQIAPNYSWTFLDWIDADGWLKGNSRQGTMSTPIKIMPQDRSYIIEAPKKPWELIVCKPSVGIPSGMNVVPIGMGLTDHKDQFLGIISGGISVLHMNQKIDHAVLNFPVKFLIADEEMNLIFHSMDENFERLGFIIRKLFADFECLENTSRHFEKPINLDVFSFFHYESIDQTPYHLFVGCEKKFLRAEFYDAFFPKIIEIFSLMIFCWVLLYIFWRKQAYPLTHLSDISHEIASGNLSIEIPKQNSYEMQKFVDSLQKIIPLLSDGQKNLALLKNSHIQLENFFNQISLKNKELDSMKLQLEQFMHFSQKSDSAHDRFMYQLNQEFKLFLEETQGFSSILLNNLTGSLDFYLSEEQEIEALHKIVKNLHVLEHLIPETLNLTAVDIQSILEESIKLHSEKAFLKNVRLVLDLSSSLSPIYLDEFLFKRIAVGLIGKMLTHLPNEGEIIISAETEQQDDQPQKLKLVIKDNGFGLNQEDIERLENNFGLKEFSGLNFMNPSFFHIQRLVEIHQGTLQFNSKWRSGTFITISFPYGLENSIHGEESTLHEEKS